MKTDRALLGAQIQRWAVTFVDPCVSDRVRAKIHRDLAAEVANDPARAAGLLAPILADVAHLLPEVDPWRSMTPAHLGSIHDHLDLVPSIGDGADWVLVAVEDGISPEVAELVWASLNQDELYERLVAGFERDIDAMLSQLDEALRWLEYRRRAYHSETDTPLIVLAAQHWTLRELYGDTRRVGKADIRHFGELWLRRVPDESYNPATRLWEAQQNFTEEEIADALR